MLQGQEIDRLNLLKNIPIFSGIKEESLKEISSISIEKFYKKGEVLILQDTEVEGLYILISGRLRITRISEDGKVKVLALLLPRDVIGEMSLLDNQLASATVEAVEDSRLLFIRREDFQSILLKHPSIILEIARILSRRLREADKEIEELSFYSVKTRLIETLINLAKKYGEKTPLGLKISMRITHQELADIVGSSRETVTRIINALERSKLIKDDNGYIILEDILGLKEHLIGDSDY